MNVPPFTSYKPHFGHTQALSKERLTKLNQDMGITRTATGDLRPAYQSLAAFEKLLKQALKKGTMSDVHLESPAARPHSLFPKEFVNPRVQSTFKINGKPFVLEEEAGVLSRIIDTTTGNVFCRGFSYPDPKWISLDAVQGQKATARMYVAPDSPLDQRAKKFFEDLTNALKTVARQEKRPSSEATSSGHPALKQALKGLFSLFTK